MPEQTESYPFRKRFLQSFVLSLIQNSYNLEEKTKKTEKDEELTLKSFIEPLPATPTKPSELPPLPKKTTSLPLPPLPPLPKRPTPAVLLEPKKPVQATLPPPPKQFTSRPENQKLLTNVQLPPLPPFAHQQNAPPIKFGKVTSLLLDPTIVSIECPGANKNIIVNKGGQIQTAQLILTKKEIDDVMNELSNKTRIPLTPGLFKIVIQDLLITAVISSYVGTRFLIQKRLPF